MKGVKKLGNVPCVMVWGWGFLGTNNRGTITEVGDPARAFSGKAGVAAALVSSTGKEEVSSQGSEAWGSVITWSMPVSGARTMTFLPGG